MKVWRSCVLVVALIATVGVLDKIRPRFLGMTPDSRVPEEPGPKDAGGPGRSRFWTAPANAAPGFDAERRRSDRQYAERVYQMLIRRDAQRLLLRPDVGRTATEIFHLIEDRFGPEAARRLLRTTYSELAGIGQFQDMLQRLDSDPRPTQTGVVPDLSAVSQSEYESRRRLYTALATKLESASKARLESELGPLEDDFVRMLYAIRPEFALPQFDNQIEPGSPLPEEE